jgi:hypothetical protein
MLGRPLSKHLDSLVHHLNQEPGVFLKAWTFEQIFTAWVSVHRETEEGLGFRAFLKKVLKKNGSNHLFVVLDLLDSLPVANHRLGLLHCNTFKLLYETKMERSVGSVRESGKVISEPHRVERLVNLVDFSFRELVVQNRLIVQPAITMPSFFIHHLLTSFMVQLQVRV